MKKTHPFPFLAAAAAALCLAAPPVADAAALPAKSIPGDSMVVIWFDAKAVPEADVKDALDTMAAIGMGGDEDPTEGLEKYGKWRKAFMDAGGEGLVMIVAAPEPGEQGEDGAPPQPEEPNVYLLAKVGPDATPEGMTAAMEQFKDEDDEDEEMVIVRAEPGWFSVHGGDEMKPLPAGGGDPAAAATFTEALNSAGDAPITAGIVLNDKARAALDQAQQNPMAMMLLGGVIPPLKQLDFGTFAVTLGEAPKMVAKMNFPEPAQAQQFVTGWTTTLQFFQNMATMDQGGGAKMDAETANKLFGMLKMDQQDKTASLTLDKAFLEVVSKLKEQEEAAEEGM